MIEEDTKKRDELRSRLIEIQETEKMNQYGIMVGSVLTVNPYEARDLISAKLSGYASPYVSMSIEGQVQKTEVRESDNNPVWQEIITFDIVSGREPLIVQLFDRAGVGSDSLIGQCEIPLDALVDQYKHDEWFEIENQKGELTGKVRLILHWIYSKKKFIQDII